MTRSALYLALLVVLAAVPAWAQEVPQTKLLPADLQADDRLGQDAALVELPDGSVLALVGAVPFARAGRVYVWRRAAEGEEWVEEATISEPNPFGAFGRAVAAELLPSGEVLAVIGASSERVGGALFAGAAYAFVREAATGAWQQEARLEASDPQAGANFGRSVALAVDSVGRAVGRAVALVGADDADFERGAAYVFEREPSAGTWMQAQRLTAADAAEDANFGSAVALSVAGDVALVGAVLDDTAAGENAGSAYVFRRDAQTGAWGQEQKLTAEDADASDFLGGAVALSTDAAVALVGASRDDTVAGENAGSAYVFRRDAQTGAWGQEQKLTAEDADAEDVFGSAIALLRSGGVALVTAPSEDERGDAAGAAYAFDFAPLVPTEPSVLDGGGGGGLHLTAYPNPARSGITLALGLGHPSRVRVEVVDVLGRPIALIHAGPLSAGEHRLAFDASALAPGLYVVRTITTDGAAATGRLAVAR